MGMAKITLVLGEGVYRTLARRHGDVSDLARELLLEALSWPEEPPPPRKPASKNTTYHPRRAREIYQNTRRMIFEAGGEWVRWTDIRPPYRDRDLYTDAVWRFLREDPVIEVRAEEHGVQTRRTARYRPII